MEKNSLKKTYEILGNDFMTAGEASSSVKKILKQLAVDPKSIKKAAIAMYEAEINAMIHGGGGSAIVEFFEDHIEINIKDNGPGIADVNLAMQEGYSTATHSVREMGFGAGMGLPNIKKQTDEMKIDTKLGEGTNIMMKIIFK